MTTTITAPLEDVLLANRGRLLAFLERRTGSREVAEDLLQTSLVQALARAPAGADEEGLLPWVYRTLRNALIDRHRRETAEASALDALMHESLHEADPELRDEVCRCVSELLPALKPSYAAALREVDLKQRPVPEVAQSEGISINNLHVRLHRARRALRQQLVSLCGACAEHGCLECGCRPRQVHVSYGLR